MVSTHKKSFLEDLSSGNLNPYEGIDDPVQLGKIEQELIQYTKRLSLTAQLLTEAELALREVFLKHDKRVRFLQDQ